MKDELEPKWTSKAQRQEELAEITKLMLLKMEVKDKLKEYNILKRKYQQLFIRIKRNK